MPDRTFYRPQVLHRSVSAGSRTGRGGFTLIELLVAMGILMIIVLITSRLFQQAAIVWDVGTQRAELNMRGRALAAYMAQELSMAVPGGFSLDTPSKVTFQMLGDADSTNRAVRKIVYTLAAPNITRTVDAGSADPMSDGVKDLRFDLIPTGASSTNMPLGVSVSVTVTNDVETRVFESRAYFENRDRNRLD